MPRPSLKSQRSEEILDAYLTCVSRFGLEGATQDRIAEEAGVKRALLHHYLGNQHQMQAAFTDWVLNKYASYIEMFDQWLDDKASPKVLIDHLFTDHSGDDPRLFFAFQALVQVSSDQPQLQALLIDSQQAFLTLIETRLRNSAPGQSEEDIRCVAQGIAAIYASMAALSPICPPKHWHPDLKNSALRLAESLHSDSQT